MPLCRQGRFFRKECHGTGCLESPDHGRAGDGPSHHAHRSRNQRRGVPIAERLAAKIEAIEGVKPKIGKLDISFYRDDYARHINPVTYATEVLFPIDGVDVVLVDDVLYTGRTVRSALDALVDLGRAKTVQLAVMVDRGHRELPIRADYVGKNVPSSHDEDVRVSIKPIDDVDGVEIWGIEKNAGGSE